ncbi:uncharacterized protein BDV14DRAFT_193424 [Aspergillus stella-maris]|uniref:uncharacterized protein n=1 Tax=Aspergillus stella-maris TaxID=1810926 RepID=UPI003CCC9142
MHYIFGFTWILLFLVAFFKGISLEIWALRPRDDQGPSQYALARERPGISLTEEWQVLGPFECGTREAIWGADPLEFWGGFQNLSFDEDAGFPSPLANDGQVRWTRVRANATNQGPRQSRAELVVAFPQIDWAFLQSIYGWSALQYQGWVRGHIRLQDSDFQSVALFTDGVLEILVDGQRHFGCDFYGYRKAPLTLDLTPGDHVIDLRLIRDVRALGGLGIPTTEVVVEAELRHGVLTVDERSLLTPESADMDTPSNLAPYQTRPLIFRITTDNVSMTEFPVTIRYRISQGATMKNQTFWVKLTERSLDQPQRYTYLHPAGVVSYAIIRPPPLDSCNSSHLEGSLPVIIGLHGAGLDADSDQARGMLDAAYGTCAWMLFPSGVTSWSGDDWHTWGVADIQAAVSAMPDWIEAVGWSGPTLSTDEWIVIGHSNGGQGVWFLTTHFPDKVIAAAPVSGYTSIEKYVSYNMWRDSEPLISSILHQSRVSYRHELLLANAAGIPILQQHGANDTNVPAYHSRLMHMLFEETGWSSPYVELPDEGHWFDGVMTTSILLKFYKNSVRSRKKQTPSKFEMYIPSSGDMASRGGIYVDQLQSPDIFGRLRVEVDSQGVWHTRTHNIHRLHLSASICAVKDTIVLALDDTDEHFKVDHSECEITWYVKKADGRWRSSKESEWKSISQRYGRQLGAMDAILRTSGVFTINLYSAGVEGVALQISRNLLQYFAADSQITRRCGMLGTTSGNLITLALGDELPDSVSNSYPIRVTDEGLILYKDCFLFSGAVLGRTEHDAERRCQQQIYRNEPAMGALFLRPLDNERLELVVWGADMSGLEQAARLVPTLTGAGQPEFLILGSGCRWKGHAGLYAAGHFDRSWQISAGSYLTSNK